MLLQFHGVFARKNTLLFLMCNQMLRLEAARAVNARVKASPESVLRYKELLNDNRLLIDLHNAIANNDKEAAKRVIARVTPILKVCSRSVPLSVGESSVFRGNMQASMHRCGPFNAFVTFAPFDILMALMQRMTYPSEDNESFPVYDMGFAESVRRCDESFQGHPLSYRDLERNLAQNPVAAEVVYNKLLEVVTSVCLGEPMEQTVKKTGAVGTQPSILGRHYAIVGLQNARAVAPFTHTLE